MKTIEDKRLEWSRLRNIPLDGIVADAGYVRDRDDRQKWKKDGSVISIKDMKLFDHISEEGGGGAIDLIKYIEQCSFQEACNILRNQGSSCSSVPPTATAEVNPLQIPPAVEGTWKQVQGWLLQARNFDLDLVETCKAEGLLHADARGNAVFPCRNAKGEVTGAEIVGPNFKGMAKGSRKDKGSFYILGENPCPTVAILTESAIDALSFHALAISHGDAVIVSTAAKLAKHDRRILRIKPARVKDWNDVLIERAGTG